MKNKYLLVVVSAILSVGIAVPPLSFASDSKKGGYLTKGKDLSGGLGLGLDVAKAMMSEKGAEEGLKKYAKGNIDKAAWGTVFEFEKLWKGQIDDTAAYTSQLKDKIDKTLEVINNVEKLATLLGGGKYDEALFMATDKLIGKIKHPVVKVAWAAIQMAYRSHKEVVATGAALEIEALYGRIDTDRRLLGVINPNEDSPKLITVDSGTVDYFFNSYIVTDDHVRGMIKTYVVNVLGEDWPEQSWSEWAYSWKAIGSGEDTGKSAETIALAGEYKDMARKWIMKLLSDVNLQVKTRWAEMRATRYAAEFKQFADRLSAFTDDLPQLMREFEAKKEYRRELPQYRELLSTSPEARKNAGDLLVKLRNMKDIQEAIDTWKSALVRGYSASRLIGEEELSNALKNELKEWWAFEKEYEKALGKRQEEVIKDPALAREEGVVFESSEVDYYKKLFEPLLVPFEWNVEPEDIYSEVEKALNSGNFENARELRDEWQNEVNVAMQEHFKEKMAKDIQAVYEKEKEPIEQEMDEIRTEYNERNIRYRGLHDQVIYGRHDEAEKNRLVAARDEAARQLEPYRIKMEKEWPELSKEAESIRAAYSMALDVRKVLMETAESLKVKTISALDEAINIFAGLRSARAKQFEAYYGLIYGSAQSLPARAITGEKYETLEDREFSKRMEVLNSAIQKVENAGYEGIGTFREPQDYFSLIRKLGEKEGDITYGMFDLTGKGSVNMPGYIERMGRIFELQSRVHVWPQAAENIRSVERLPAEDIKEMEVLLDISEKLMEIEAFQKAAEKLPAFAESVQAKIDRLYRLVEEDSSKKQDAVDWLRNTRTAVERFFTAQEEKGVIFIEGDGTCSIALKDGGDVYIESDLLISKKPYKRYLIAKEVKAIADGIRNSWQGYSGYRFIRDSAPGVNAMLENSLRELEKKAATEDNFFAPTEQGEIVIWESSVANIEKAAGDLKYDASDIEFIQKLNVIMEAVPGAITSSGDAAMPYDTDKSYEANAAAFNHSLGKSYVKVLKELDNIFEKRKEYLKKASPAGPSGPGVGGPEGPGVPGEPKGPQGPQVPQDPPPGGPKGPEKPLGVDGPQVGPPIDRKADRYEIYDARVNSISLKNASGEVVLTNSEIKQDRIELTARLSTLQWIEKILVSVDGGMSWNEVPVTTIIRYDFTPIPNRIYRPVVRIKTTDIDDVRIEIFPNISGIVYKDTDYDSLAVDMVRRIAEAYEGKNISLFSDHVSRDFLGNRTFLIEGVRFDFDMFNDIRLVIFINRIEKRADLFIAETKWTKTQVPRKTGLQQRTTGNTTMIMTLEDGKMKIKNLRGNLIYATLSPEIAEASGLPSDTVEAVREARDERNPIQPGAGETEESGGVSSILGVQNASLTSAPPMGGPNIACFDFASGTVIMGSGNGDFDFTNGNMFAMNNGARIQQAVSSFNDTSEAPTGGYALNAAVAPGNVYVFITRGGLYGKLEIQTLTNNPPINDTVTFKYALQTDGSRDIPTN